jgi:4-hydroxy-2-oxoglutarate aldolase
VTGRILEGVLAPVTTPFDPSGAVALGPAVENAKRLLEQGLAGLVSGGSTGEAPLLEADEQRRLVAALRPVVPRDRWLIAGTGAESTRATIALTQAAAAEGADAVLVRPPGYYSPALDADAVGAHFQAVADASPIPVLLYNIPKYTHFPLPVSLLQRLAAHRNVIGIKDSSGDRANLAAYREAVPAWTVLVGSGSLLLYALELGCAGGICGVACYAAPLAVQVIAAFRRNDRDQAATLQTRLGTLDKEIVSRHGPSGIKVAMEIVGLYGGPVRAPLAELAAPDRQRIAGLLAA